MSRIPSDITQIIREIDEELKSEGVSPPGRPIKAIIKFGQRFNMPMLFANPPPGVRNHLTETLSYTERIHAWYEEVYADKIKLDPSANAKIAVEAHGDLWELKLPIVYGSFMPVVDRDISGDDDAVAAAPRLNICKQLSGITAARLKLFSEHDLHEIYGMFMVGMDVRHAFEKLKNSSYFFNEANSDWMAAVMHMTGQNPNYGQARWSSLQCAEKFMKGLLEVIGDVSHIPRTHKLQELHDALAPSIIGLDLSHHIANIQCAAAVRYGEEPSAREQAYAAHKSNLLLVRTLGNLKNANEE